MQIKSESEPIIPVEVIDSSSVLPTRSEPIIPVEDIDSSSALPTSTLASLEPGPVGFDRTAIGLIGWTSLAIQLALALTCGVFLIVASFGSEFSTDANRGIGVGVFFGVCGIVALCISVLVDYRYTQVSKKLRNPNPAVRPNKADTMNLLRLGIIVGLVGMLLNLLGAGSTLNVLVAKAVSQSPGMTIIDANNIIRALDVFVELANVIGIAAHYAGTLASILLLERVYHHHP